MNASTNYPDDERLKILKMIEDGKISANEGAELLKALGQDRKRAWVTTKPPGSSPRWFKVSVTDVVTGKSRASVTIPMSLMDWGLKVGAQFAPQADIDLDGLREALSAGIEGKILDVIDEEDGEHVEIYVE